MVGNHVDGAHIPGSKVSGNPPLSLPGGTHQLLLLLQHLRERTRLWLYESGTEQSRQIVTEDILPALQGMALAARQSGMPGYAAVCLRVAENMEPLRRSGSVPKIALQRLSAWMLSADRYLRRPGSVVLITALVGHLGASGRTAGWDYPLSEAEEEMLIREMIEPFSL